MRIRTRVFLLISFIALFFITAIILLYNSGNNKMESLYGKIQAERDESFKKTVLTVGQSLELFTYDYTYWDELVDFVKTNDTSWAYINLELALPNYNIQSVWIYSPDFSLLYSTTSDDLPGELPFTEEIFRKIFKDGYFCHFFLKIDSSRILEIRGAPVQPSTDVERKTKPYAYFFAARLWNDKLLSDMSVQSTSKVHLHEAGEQCDKDESADNFIVVSSITLAAWDGKPVMNVVSSGNVTILKDLDDLFDQQLLSVFIFSFLILAIVAYFFIRNVNKPLDLISRSLEEENPELLKILSSDKTELGRLSLLIVEFFNQKQKLLNEIKQREQTEISLQKSEEKYRKIFENVQDIVFQADENGFFASISPSVLRYSGYHPDELIGRTIKEYFKSPDEAGKMFEELMKKGEVINFETVLLAKDGRPVNVLISSHLLYDNEPRIKGIEGTIRDVTELKQKEEKIKKLSRAIEQSPVSVIITNTSGEIEYVNPKFSEVSGYSIDELSGQKPSILKSGFQSDEDYKNLWETIRSGKEWKGEFYNKKKNGELYWESILISPIKNGNDRITNFLGIKEDITEKKNIHFELERAKEKAEEMNRLKSSFLANMSHELRTPLIAILGFSEILTAEIINKEHKSMVETIRQGGIRLLETLNQILDLSRYESEMAEINYEKLYIEEIISESVNLFSQVARKNNLYLVQNICRKNITAVSDRRLLLNLLNNLIGNAVKFTRSGGITVDLDADENEGGSFIIRVKDTGIGIPEKYKDIIFDEFRQVSEGLNRKFEGSGLGLSITKKIVEKFKGKITVESKVGSGSVFTVILPLCPTEELTVRSGKEENEFIQPEAGEHNKSILFIDDDNASRQIVKIYLKNEYILDVVSDPGAAMEKIESKLYSVILLDINLGNGESGIDLLKEIRKKKRYNDVPVIAVTAYAMKEEKEKFLNEGFNGYLSKPFFKKDLLELIRNYSPAIKLGKAS